MALGNATRRRRVLKEDLLATNASPQTLAVSDEREPAGESGLRYSAGAGKANQLRATKFIPTQLKTFWLLASLGLLFIISLAATLLYLPQIENLKTANGLTFEKIGLNAATIKTLVTQTSAWFNSSALLLAAGYSVLIYSLRRYQIGDYQGRYRIWSWAAGTFLLLSLLCSTQIPQLIATILYRLTAKTALSNHAAWWIGIGLVSFGWIGLKSVIDLKESRLALTAAMGATACFVFSTLLQTTPMVELHSAISNEILALSTTLLGSLFGLMSLTSYGRFVILDTQGLIIRTKKSNAAESTEQKNISADDSTKQRQGWSLFRKSPAALAAKEAKLQAKVARKAKKETAQEEARLEKELLAEKKQATRDAKINAKQKQIEAKKALAEEKRLEKEQRAEKRQAATNQKAASKKQPLEAKPQIKTEKQPTLKKPRAVPYTEPSLAEYEETSPESDGSYASKKQPRKNKKQPTQDYNTDQWEDSGHYDSYDEEPEMQNLSKSQRKKLRKQQRRQAG